MIRDVYPGSESRILTFYPSRIPDPAPQHWYVPLVVAHTVMDESNRTGVAFLGEKMSHLILSHVPDLDGVVH
jgi:hypothetical protein